MAIMSQIAETAGFAEMPEHVTSVDLESGHRVINHLIEVLQRKFKEDTQYLRPMMSPQANIIFALDRDAAESMVEYMTLQLKETGLEENEFRFVRKANGQEEVLQRLRLEFPNGVNAHIIRKLMIAADRLERTLPAYTA